MTHEESNLQRQCVAWFRAQYPQYAMLLTHPINEGSGHTSRDRMRQGIHKAEGAVAGVADLLLFIPSYMPATIAEGYSTWTEVHGLGIEMKTAKGKQSAEQMAFQQMFEAAGYAYRVVRSLEEFRLLITAYINTAYEGIKCDIDDAYRQQRAESERKEKEHFYKVIGKK